MDSHVRHTEDMRTAVMHPKVMHTEVMHPRVRAQPVTTSTGTRYWVDETCWADLTDLPRELDERLRATDGWTPGARLHRGLPEHLSQRYEAIIALFQDSGLAVDGQPTGRMRTLDVALLGSGALARSLAATLLRGGLGRLSCWDPTPPDPLVWPQTRRRTGAAALVASLRPRQDVVVREVDTVSALADQRCDLVLVAPATLEPDRLLLVELVRLGLPHLVLGAHRDVGRIGPLVRPGATACLTCHDLVRGQTDRHWPLVVAQLSQLPARPHPTLTAALAARAALEVGWLARDGTRPGALEGRVELLDLQHPGPREVTLVRHPDCGCHGGG